MAVSSVRTKHWTRVEYERLIDLGAFRPGERLELVGGAVVVREPQGGPHATAVGLTEDELRQVFGTGWTVRTHSPIALDEDSEPEPDIAVVAGSRRDHRHVHPARPVLIVEVADSSFEFDRREKASSTPEPGSWTTGSSISGGKCWKFTESRWLTLTRGTAIATERPSR